MQDARGTAAGWELTLTETGLARAHSAPHPCSGCWSDCLLAAPPSVPSRVLACPPASPTPVRPAQQSRRPSKLGLSPIQGAESWDRAVFQALISLIVCTQCTLSAASPGATKTARCCPGGGGTAQLKARGSQGQGPAGKASERFLKIYCLSVCLSIYPPIHPWDTQRFISPICHFTPLTALVA